MVPWVRLGKATVVGESHQLELMQRGHEFSIRVGTTELMNSRLSGSEEALAELAAARLGGRSQPQVLIGGLGMGFTLRAAQKAFALDARLTVAELVPEVVEWAKGPLRPIFGDCLEDSRVQLSLGDVRQVISENAGAFDSILLDVDNGPEALTRRSNRVLYGARGLTRAFQALRAGGVLGVWSAGEDAQFTGSLKRAGFTVETKRVRARTSGGGSTHMIWMATKPG